MGVQISQFGPGSKVGLAGKIAACIRLPCPSWRSAVDSGC
jgi:hypothetical protein